MSTVRVVVEGFESAEEAAWTSARAQSIAGRVSGNAPLTLRVEADGKRLIFTGFPSWDAAMLYAEWLGTGAPDRIIVECEEVKLISYPRRAGHI